MQVVCMKRPNRIAACDQIVKQLNIKKMARIFFVKIVAGPCWRVLELILHRAKKKRRKAANYFASLSGKRQMLMFLRWKFYAQSSAFNRHRLKMFTFMKWKKNLEFLRCLKKVVKRILNSNVKQFACLEGSSKRRKAASLGKEVGSGICKQNSEKKCPTKMDAVSVLQESFRPRPSATLKMHCIVC